MLKIKDIEHYANDSILDSIFREREEELYDENSTQDLELNKIKKDYPTNYEKLLIAINNLPPQFCNTREGILEALEKYSTREHLILAHYNEKFYKARFL